MKPLGILLLLILLAVPAVILSPTAAQPARAQVFVFSNSAPHITVIDAQTNQVVKTATIPQMTSWGWNDDNNYYDGKYLWLGMRNPDTNDVEVVLLDLDTLQVAKRIPVGQDRSNLFIGKPSRTGRLLVSKLQTGQLVAIDIKTQAVVQTTTLPVSGGVACDVDTAVAMDGKERVYVPIFRANTVLSVDPATLEVLQTLRFPEGTQPWMVTATPDGRRLWVQEQNGASNVILNAMTLQMVERVPAGTAPDTGTFSPDGKVHYTGHFTDAVVVANDTETFREMWRTRVGAFTRILGVHPSGRFVYAIASNEGAVAALDAATGRIVTRIALGTNPSGLFVRRL